MHFIDHWKFSFQTCLAYVILSNFCCYDIDGRISISDSVIATSWNWLMALSVAIVQIKTVINFYKTIKAWTTGVYCCVERLFRKGARITMQIIDMRVVAGSSSARTQLTLSLDMLHVDTTFLKVFFIFPEIIADNGYSFMRIHRRHHRGLH